MAKTIAVDFDGVIHAYSKGWQDGKIYDPPVHGVREALQTFLNDGYEIVIYTTRADDREINGVMQSGQYEEVVQYLSSYAIPYTRVHRGAGKPLCKLFIDDNALRFEGDWPATLAQANAILNRPIARG